MKTPLKILMLEDSAEDAEIIQRLLLKDKMNCEFCLVMDKRNYMKALDDFFPEIIISDHSMPSFDSSDALNIARQKLPGIPFIMVTGSVSEEFAANIIKQGADDYILKDRLTRLPTAIKAALVKRKAVKELNDYKYALDQSAIVGITDNKGNITYANKNFCRISKYSMLELIGQNHSILNADYHPPSFFKEMWSTISTGKNWMGEFCNKAKDSSLYWVETYIVPFLDHLHQPYQYLSISQDITKRKKAEEEVLRNEVRLNEAQSVGHIANWEVDMAHNTHTWSDELYNILGLVKGEVEPSTEVFLSMLHEEDANDAAQLIKEQLKQLNDYKMDFRFKLNDGKKRYGHLKWKFEFNKAGKPIRNYGILQDITLRKEAEENVKLLEKKVHDQKMLEQKKIALAILKGQELERNFIGQELHDNINQILASSKMYLKTAAKKDETVQEVIKYPVELIELSISEIRQLTQKLVMPKKDITLKEMVDDCLYAITVNTNVQTNLLYNINEAEIPEDLKLNIYRIIQELLHNASKYAEAKNVNIDISANTGFLTIVVTDDGVGFNTKLKRHGIGISNIISRVKCFSGKLTINSSPGNGCETIIKIPY